MLWVGLPCGESACGLVDFSGNVAIGGVSCSVYRGSGRCHCLVRGVVWFGWLRIWVVLALLRGGIGRLLTKC